MKMSAQEIKALITQSELLIKQAYQGKIDDDEYFKRGFLLACQQFSRQMVTVLGQYDVTSKDEPVYLCKRCLDLRKEHNEQINSQTR